MAQIQLTHFTKQPNDVNSRIYTLTHLTCFLVFFSTKSVLLGLYFFFWIIFLRKITCITNRWMDPHVRLSFFPLPLSHSPRFLSRSSSAQPPSKATWERRWSATRQWMARRGWGRLNSLSRVSWKLAWRGKRLLNVGGQPWRQRALLGLPWHLSPVSSRTLPLIQLRAHASEPLGGTPPLRAVGLLLHAAALPSPAHASMHGSSDLTLFIPSPTSAPHASNRAPDLAPWPRSGSRSTPLLSLYRPIPPSVPGCGNRATAPSIPALRISENLVLGQLRRQIDLGQAGGHGFVKVGGYGYAESRTFWLVRASIFFSFS